ncbi:MAG: twin-arginine translocase subunit TatB [Alphaproteobacteria bacterium]|nr:twin-arginine translocase subunit TatB [Alphaproteobacteria bacterium]
MFDIGWTEVMVIVAVAVIVVGPKDIPKMLKTVGKYLRKAKTMMRDVRRQVEEVADISELKQLKADAEKMTKDMTKDMGVDSFDDPMKVNKPDPSFATPDPTFAEAKPAAAKPEAKIAAKTKPKAKPKATTKKTTKPKTVAKKAPVKKTAAKKSTVKKTTAPKAPIKKAVKSAS